MSNQEIKPKKVKSDNDLENSMGELNATPGGFFITKKLENLKKLIGQEVVLFNTNQMQKDGVNGTLTAEIDAKGREIFRVGLKGKFQWKHVLWWRNNYIHIDNKKYPIIKVDLNRK